jgi:hypothetical protein
MEFSRTGIQSTQKDFGTERPDDNCGAEEKPAQNKLEKEKTTHLHKKASSKPQQHVIPQTTIDDHNNNQQTTSPATTTQANSQQQPPIHKINSIMSTLKTHQQRAQYANELSPTLVLLLKSDPKSGQSTVHLPAN